jgi:hypothetical protein
MEWFVNHRATDMPRGMGNDVFCETFTWFYVALKGN